MNAQPAGPLAPEPATVRFSVHAIEQYQDRVKPGLGKEQVAAELSNLAPVGEVVTQHPGWARVARPAPFYLLLAGVAFPLKQLSDGSWLALTALTDESKTDRQRAARRARRATKAGKLKRPRRAR